MISFVPGSANGLSYVSSQNLKGKLKFSWWRDVSLRGSEGKPFVKIYPSLTYWLMGDHLKTDKAVKTFEENLGFSEQDKTPVNAIPECHLAMWCELNDKYLSV